MRERPREWRWQQEGAWVAAQWSDGLLTVQSSRGKGGWQARLSGPPEGWLWEPPGGPRTQNRGWDLRDGWRRRCRRGPPFFLRREIDLRYGLASLRLRPSRDAALCRLLGESSARLLDSIEPARLRGVLRLAPRHRVDGLWLLRHDRTGRLLQLLEGHPGLFLFRLALETDFGSTMALARFDEGIQRGTRLRQLEQELLEAWAWELSTSLPGLVTSTESRRARPPHKDEERPDVAHSFQERIGSHSVLLRRLTADCSLPLMSLRLPLPVQLSPAQVGSLTHHVGALRLLAVGPRLTATDDPRWSEAATWLALHADEFTASEGRHSVPELEEALLQGASPPARDRSVRSVVNPARGLPWGLARPTESMALPLLPEAPAPFPVRRIATLEELAEAGARFENCLEHSMDTADQWNSFVELSPGGRPLIAELYLDEFGRWHAFEVEAAQNEPINPVEREAIGRWLQGLPVGPLREDMPF